MKIKIIVLTIMMLFIISFTCFVFFVKAAEVEYNDPITPNGTIVPYQIISTEMSSSDKYKYISDEQKYIDNGAIRLDEPTNKYNSHSYAWYSQFYETNNYTISNTDVMKYYQDGSYCESLGNEGDIICYWRIKLVYNDSSKTQLDRGIPYLAHSGIITSINGTFDPDDLDTLENITVVSKWGKGGLFEHSGDNNPYYYDSIHGSGNPIDTLHFEDVSSSYIDDALFYVKVYTPKVDGITSIFSSENPYTFEKTINPSGYAMYKLNIIDSGTYNFKTESSGLTDIKIYNNNMNLIYDQEVHSSSISYINTSVSAGIYYLRVAFKNDSTSGIITTLIESVSDSSSVDSGILIDSQFSGSEVYLNNGVVGGNTITEGFTRYLFLNPAVAPSTSRLAYDWYSSNPGKATVSQYGTVLAKNGTGNPQVTITAIYKNDRSIVFTKTFTILDETKTFVTDPIYVYGSITVECGKGELLALPDDAPYNFNQYYAWSTGGNTSISVSNYGTITSFKTGTYTITGTYTYNKRVKIIITVNVE